MKTLQQCVEFIQSDVILQLLFSTLKLIGKVLLYLLLSTCLPTDYYPVFQCLIKSQINEKKTLQ